MIFRYRFRTERNWFGHKNMQVQLWSINRRIYCYRQNYINIQDSQFRPNPSIYVLKKLFGKAYATNAKPPL